MDEIRGFKQFAEWKRELLHIRGLQFADGRALYLYRLTDDEFSALEALLHKSLGLLLERYDLATVAALSGFPGLFVLYGSEWWRRRYDGSGFSWEPILRDLGADPSDWSPGERSEVVRKGLQEWKLKPRTQGALRFLGTVAVQGGLPLRLLASAHGKIGYVLSRVLRLASGASVAQSDLQTWVESLSAYLPKSYQQETIYTLLTDVAWAVLRLKEEARLSSADDAIEVLDRAVPDWRERFPLPVGDKHARGMIEQLVRDAAAVRIERRSVVLPVERWIEKGSDETWKFRSRVALDDSISLKELAGLYDVDETDLPRSAKLSLKIREEQRVVSLRRMAGHPAYRVDRVPWGAADGSAASEHILRLSAADGRVWSITAAKGEPLDAELPWVFAEKDGELAFTGQGSTSVPAHKAFVALPAGWEVDAAATSNVVECGKLSELDRSLFEISGAVRVHATDATIRVRTGQACVEESYVLGGDRYWLDFESPPMAIRGTPALCRVDEDGGRRKVEGQLGLSVIGAKTAKTAFGPVAVRYPATGEIRFRNRVVLLPFSASLKLEPMDATSGVMRFQNWGISSAQVLTPSLSYTFDRQGADLLLKVTADQSLVSPDYLDLEVLWPHTTTPARLRAPFPALGVQAFDGAGLPLASGALVAAQQLAGIRLSVAGGADYARVELNISVNHGRAARKHRLRSLPGALSLEIRLQDFLADILELLSSDDTPDTLLNLSIAVDGVDTFSLNIARYAAALKIESDDVWLDWDKAAALDLDELASLPVMAIRLDRVGDEPLALPSQSSEGVATGAWRFNPLKREPGAWLIYPGKDSKIPFRPTLWPVEGVSSPPNRLAEAINFSDESERIAALDTVIDTMAQDFAAVEWDDVEHLIGHVGHLPLATLDLWRRLTHSAEGMAALAMRLSSLRPEILARFSQELPFAWETISLSAWQGAMAGLRQQCTCSFGEEGGAVVMRSHLDSRVKSLCSISSSLSFLLGIVGSEFLPDTQQDVKGVKALGAMAEQMLFEGERSDLNTLRQAHAEDQWPTDFNSILSSRLIDADEALKYLHTRDVDYQLGVVNLPLLLAVQVVADQTGAWFADARQMNYLRTQRAFDPQWFEEAYNLTVARCFADGLFKL